MPITCFIRYQIDPFQREERSWLEVVAGTVHQPRLADADVAHALEALAEVAGRGGWASGCSTA